MHAWVIRFCRDSKNRDRIYPKRSEGSHRIGIKPCVKILRLTPQDSFCRESRQKLIKVVVVLLLAHTVCGAPSKTKSHKRVKLPVKQTQKRSRQVSSKQAQKQPSQRSPKGAKKGPSQPPSKKVLAPSHEALYARLGGDQTIAAVVDQFAANCAGDFRVASYFKGTVADAARFSVFKRNLADQICALSGGPCRYSGKSMKSAHLGMGVRNEHFDALIENFTAALDQFKVRSTEQTELIKMLSAMRAEIVEKKL